MKLQMNWTSTHLIQLKVITLIFIVAYHQGTFITSSFFFYSLICFQTWKSPIIWQISLLVMIVPGDVYRFWCPRCLVESLCLICSFVIHFILLYSFCQWITFSFVHLVIFFHYCYYCRLSSSLISFFSIFYIFTSFSFAHI